MRVVVCLMVVWVAVAVSVAQRIPGPGGMAPASVPAGPLVNAVCGPAEPGPNGGASAPVDMTGAGLLVLFKVDNAVGAISSVPTNSWAGLVGYSRSNLYVADFGVVSNAMTFSETGGAVYAGFCAAGFAGYAGLASYEAGSWQADAGVAPSVTVTPVGLGPHLIVSGSYCDVGATTLTPVDGFLPVPPWSIDYHIGLNYAASMAYQVVNTNDPVVVGWSQSPLMCGSAVVVAAAFQSYHP